MKHTANLALNLPERIDQFNVDHSNQNFAKIDTTITANKTEILTTLTSQTTRLQAQIDRLRYNEYVQFVKEHYSNTPYRALGYFCDIFANYANVEYTHFQNDGIEISNSSLKMSKCYKMEDLGKIRNSSVQCTQSSQRVTIPLTLTPVGASSRRIQFSFQINCIGNNKIYVTSNSGGHLIFDYNGGGWRNVEGTLDISTAAGKGDIYVNGASGYDCNFQVGVDTTAGGNFIHNGATQAGKPVGYYGERSLETLQSNYISKWQSGNTAFDMATFYMRYSNPAQTEAIPYIAANGSSEWRPFTLVKTDNTTNHAGVACQEGTFTIANLPRSSGFKIKLALKRASINNTPTIYDYCLVYGEK